MKNKLSKDIELAAHTKLASIMDYVKPALVGGGLLTGAAAIPAALNAYANDTDPLKSIASTAQYTVPIGMALGMGTVPISKLEDLITGAISKIPSKSEIIDGGSDIMSAIMAKSPDPMVRTDIMGSLRAGKDDLMELIRSVGGEFAQSGRDLIDIFRG